MLLSLLRGLGDGGFSCACQGPLTSLCQNPIFAFLGSRVEWDWVLGASTSLQHSWLGTSNLHWLGLVNSADSITLAGPSGLFRNTHFLLLRLYFFREGGRISWAWEVLCLLDWISRLHGLDWVAHGESIPGIEKSGGIGHEMVGYTMHGRSDR